MQGYVPGFKKIAFGNNLMQFSKWLGKFYNFLYHKKLKVLLPKITLTHFTLKHLHTNEGVTLIELIMVIVVVGVLAGGLSFGINEVIDLWNFLTFRNEIASQGRMSLMRMGREIRQIKDNSSIDVASDMQFQFDDVDNNNITYCRADANCNYDINGGYLCRNNNIMAGEVTDFTFTYYAKDNNELAKPVSDLTDIYRIAMVLTLTRGNQTLALRSQVFPRNL